MHQCVQKEIKFKIISINSKRYDFVRIQTWKTNKKLTRILAFYVHSFDTKQFQQYKEKIEITIQETLMK